MQRGFNFQRKTHHKNRIILSAVLLTLLLILYFLGAPVSGSANDLADSTSLYIAIEDDLRLAADVHLPKSLEEGEKVPALLFQTRYWRSSRSPIVPDPDPADPNDWADNDLLNPIDSLFLANGYAIVKVDVRGTGASFGSRPIEYGPQEVMDGYAVVDWIISQPWSDGTVGAYGISYTGTTAEFLSAVKHPAVKAVVPGWSDFDAYKSPVKPYGMQSDAFILTWGTYVGLQDANNWQALGAGVRPVDADTDASLLTAAVAEHAANVEVYSAVSAITYRDEEFGDSGLSFHDISSISWMDEIQASGAAMFVMASWLDAGVADGALLRYLNYSNPQKLLILASSHGGGNHASPYVVNDIPLDPIPSRVDQWTMAVQFLDYYLKEIDNGVDKWPDITYFNLAEEKFKETDTWPPAGSKKLRLYMEDDNRLSSKRPRTRRGKDEYVVDFEVTTGEYSRWQTQMGLPVLNLDNRGEMDARMLTYTSKPLPCDLQITGWPVVSLKLSSTCDDGAFLAYLEDLDETGKSVYVTEGGLRGIHRKVSENPYLYQPTPYHSFSEADGKPLIPGKMTELVFEMQPTSVLLRKGHRIRVAIAGADRDNFDRNPAEGIPTIEVGRNKWHASYIDLPIVHKGKRRYGRLKMKLK
jgi:putative CocE/NonD family hydrolase